MSDIYERLKAEAEKVSVMDAPLYYVHISCAEAREVVDTIEALRAENARLREALKPFAEVGECESASFSYHFIRAARAAMGEIDND